MQKWNRREEMFGMPDMYQGSAGHGYIPATADWSIALQPGNAARGAVLRVLRVVYPEFLGHVLGAGRGSGGCCRPWFLEQVVGGWDIWRRSVLSKWESLPLDRVERAMGSVIGVYGGGGG